MQLINEFVDEPFVASLVCPVFVRSAFNNNFVTKALDAGSFFHSILFAAELIVFCHEEGDWDLVDILNRGEWHFVHTVEPLVRVLLEAAHH